MHNPDIRIAIEAFCENLAEPFVIFDGNNLFCPFCQRCGKRPQSRAYFDNRIALAKDCGVTLVNNVSNLGKGVAIIRGFRRARGDVVVTMDADGSHRAEDIPRLLYPILNGWSVEATVGSRFVDERGRRSTSRLHLVGNRIINFLILVFTGRVVSDSQSGFRAYRRDVLGKITLHSSGFDIESEMTIKLLKRGVRIMEIPIRCDPRRNGFSRVNSFKDGYNIVKAIIKSTFYSILS